VTEQNNIKFDVIGYWSEVKLDIVKKYAAAYSKILASQSRFSHIYIDAFSGAGIHISKATDDYVPGSPLNALDIEEPFCQYHFIDYDGVKVNHLRKLTKEKDNVRIYEGDCNKILLEKVFPEVKYGNYKRGLCLLDPYGLHLDWSVIETAGKMKSLEIFLNFPIMDMNRNAIWKNFEKVPEENQKRMTSYWGDESWKDIAYSSNGMLFKEMKEKTDNEAIVQAFQERLKNVACFDNVPDPLPMKNTRGAVVYYLFFAAQKPVANKIVKEIFEKYR